MKGRFRQHCPGSWEISYELGRDSLGKRRRESITVRGVNANGEMTLGRRGDLTHQVPVLLVADLELTHLLLVVSQDRQAKIDPPS